MMPQIKIMKNKTIFFFFLSLILVNSSNLYSQVTQDDIDRYLRGEYYVFTLIDGYNKKERIGTFASKEEICELFEHPIFSSKKINGYVHVPIDDVIEDFIKMLPFEKSLITIGLEFADIHNKRNRSIFHLTQTSSSCMPLHLYGGQAGAPKVKWQQAISLSGSKLEWQLMAHGASRPIFNLSYPDEFNIYALLLLKEMHPVLIKKFDELHQNNLALIAADEARKLEIEKEKIRIEAQQKKEEAERILRENELRIQAENEKERLRIEAQQRNMRLDELRIQEERVEREETANRRLYRLLIIFFLIVSGLIYLHYRNKLEERRKLEEKEHQRKIDEQKNLEAKKERIQENKKRNTLVTKYKNWNKRRSTLSSQINQIKKRQSQSDKDALDLMKELETLKSKKKKLDEQIEELTKDIQDEKKVVKFLREKYPFIDAYLDNR